MDSPNARLLILETSGRVGQVALAEGEQLVGVRRLDAARRHARDLAPAVADLLRHQGWMPGELRAVIVSQGPGSYTGLRVGIMAAKTLAYAVKIPLIAIPTFRAIALQSPRDMEQIEVIADAQQDKIYVERFRGGTAESLVALRIVPISEWLARHDPAAWVTGPGLRLLASRLPAGTHIVTAEDWDPRAESLLVLGQVALQEQRYDDPWAVEPLYLRPSAAEEKWQKSH